MPIKMKRWDHFWMNATYPERVKEGYPLLLKGGFDQQKIESITRAFTPSDCRPQCGPSEVLGLLCLVAEEVYSMAFLDRYLATPSARSIVVPWKSYKETPTHHELKQDATEWLLTEKKVASVLYEQDFGGGVCDVKSICGKWIIECGASRPDKVLDHFASENTLDTSIVFFGISQRMVFTAGPRLQEFNIMNQKISCSDKADDLFEKLCLGDKAPPGP